MHSVSFCSTCKCCSPHLMTPIKIKILLNELQWLGRENYLSSSEAKSIEIFIGRARDLFAQAVGTTRPIQNAPIVRVRIACVAIKVRYK